MSSVEEYYKSKKLTYHKTWKVKDTHKKHGELNEATKDIKRTKEAQS